MERACAGWDTVQQSEHLVHCVPILISPLLQVDEDSPVDALIQLVSLDEGLHQVARVQLQIHASSHGDDDSACSGMRDWSKGVLKVLSLLHLVTHDDEPDLAIRDLSCFDIALDIIMNLKAQSKHTVIAFQFSTLPVFQTSAFPKA
eukprot:2088363-Rhodomonas_salina.1